MPISDYSILNQAGNLPRLPLEGWLDVTYRCNNNCRHCWIRIPKNSPLHKKELSFDQIKNVVLEARHAGCRHWSISGGEPMLRADFSEIFHFVTSVSASYSLNTNGTLITPEIAKSLCKRGYKMVALYGADEATYEKITRVPGSFQACIQGFAYLKEAKAGFTVQIIPMRDNFHQLAEMIDLAKQLSPSFRIGASWLYLSAYLDSRKNKEILAQRLPPSEVVRIDQDRPTLDDYLDTGQQSASLSCCRAADEKLLQPCISKGKEFHIDPYGLMAICSFMKDPSLRYDLKEHSFEQIWDTLIPNLQISEASHQEYREKCGICASKSACHWCPAYAYLETGRISGPVPYLCEVAQERIKYKEKWMKENYQSFEIADITIHVDSDIPLTPQTFSKRFETFRSPKKREDNLYISHHFFLPDLAILQDAELVYDKLPWAVYKYKDSYIYLCLGAVRNHAHPNAVAVFDQSHSRVRVYHKTTDLIAQGNLGALTGFPSDQIMIAHALSHRQGCYFHSAGVIINGKGILFLGHSGAGKSTIVKILKHYGSILSDDRNIVRYWPEGHRLHGTWSHGEVPLVLNASAPLEAIVFIEKDEKTHLARVIDARFIFHQLLNRLIKPFVTKEWWQKSLDLLPRIAADVPCYRLQFTKKSKEVLKAVSEIAGPLVKNEKTAK